MVRELGAAHLMAARLEKPLESCEERLDRLVDDLRENDLNRSTRLKIHTYVEKYKTIMHLYRKVRVSQDDGFKKLYKGFYKVRRGEPWCKTYFSELDKLKRHPMTFRKILQELCLLDPKHRVESSFASKMLATRYPQKYPPIDQWVLKNLDERLPHTDNKKRKIEEISQWYTRVVKCYHEWLVTKKGKWLVDFFDRRICPNSRIPKVKKLDFILWQARSRGKGR